jgi:hypothetical protein
MIWDIYSRIPDLDFFLSRIPGRGATKHRIPDPQHCLNFFYTRFRKNKVYKEFVSAINRGKGCFGNFDLFSFLPHWNQHGHATKFTPFLITQRCKNDPSRYGTIKAHKTRI